MNEGRGDVTPESRTLGREIAGARVRRGWTQNDLAAASGFNQATIAKWEVGRRSPKAEDLLVLARVLQASAGDWLDAAQKAVEKGAG